MIIFKKIFNSLVFMGASGTSDGPSGTKNKVTTATTAKDIDTKVLNSTKAAAADTKDTSKVSNIAASTNAILADNGTDAPTSVDKADTKAPIIPVIANDLTPNKPTVLEKLKNNKSSVAAASVGLASTGAAVYFGAKYFNDAPGLMGGGIPESLVNNPVINQPAFLNVAKSDIFKNFLANSDKKYDSLLSAFNKEGGIQGIGAIIAGGSEKLNSSLELLTKNAALLKDASFLNILGNENSAGLLSLFSNKDLFSAASATYFSKNSTFLGKFKDLTDIDVMKNLLANPPKGMPGSVQAFFNNVSTSGDLDKMKALANAFDPANKELLASMNALFANPKYAEFIKSPGAMEMISGTNAEYLKILSENQGALADLLKNPDIAALMNNSEFQALFTKNPSLEALISNDKENLLAALNDKTLPEFVKAAGDKNLELVLSIGAALGAALLGVLAYSLWKGEVKAPTPASFTPQQQKDFDNFNESNKEKIESVSLVDKEGNQIGSDISSNTATPGGADAGTPTATVVAPSSTDGGRPTAPTPTTPDMEKLTENLLSLPQFEQMKKGLVDLGKNLSEGKIDKTKYDEAQIGYIIDILFDGKDTRGRLNLFNYRIFGIFTNKNPQAAIIPENFKITKKDMEEILQGTGLKLKDNFEPITKDDFKNEFTKVFENIMNEYLKLDNKDKKFDPKVDMNEFIKEGITGALMNLDCVEKVETNKDKTPSKQ